LHGSSILNANTISGEDGRPAVSIRTGGSEVSYFSRVTSENINKPLATIYVETQTNKQLIDNKIVTTQKQIEKVISMANIQSTLGNQFQITGLDSMTYAQNLALLLRSGAYAAPVQFIQERLVGPSLGKENIRLGVISCEIAYLLVVIFMALYYRVFGLVADLALILNVLLVIAIMSILGATMTLPGMAALVLTVGMSVDGNVLINERIREELRNGMSPLASIRAGYDRAFSTIVDANVSTLIVAVVLFALGTGPVQGFAVTLTIGILASMVTSIYFTRTLVHLIYGRRNVKRLSIGINGPIAKGYRSKNAVS
jgi:preprotein translocase subunit SecD